MIQKDLNLFCFPCFPADEATEVADVLQRFTDRRDAALRHLAWALLASTEFCVNH